MKCHYEVLGVSQTASYGEIEEAYRELKAQLHPGNNINNREEAEEQFEIVQRAWEVLSDHHESAWYDKHREAILHGGELLSDGTINLLCYFRSDCFEDYRDDENGFYSVHRSAFEKIAAEEAEIAEDDFSDQEVPSFGNSQSSFEVMCNFYSYWESYDTKMRFTWLNLYDSRHISNQHVAKFAEDENMRFRELAIQGRNQVIRNLVAFIKKRDKRVKAFGEFLEERENENVRIQFGWIQLYERSLLMKEKVEEDEEDGSSDD